MKIEAKDLRCKVRQPLQDLIPLPAPFIVYIDPTTMCNFKCTFCPTGDPELLKLVGRPRATMSLDLFHKIVGDLKEFDRPMKMVSLYKDGEPLVNPHFSMMTQVLKNSGVAERIWTKTNGSLLTPARNRLLVQNLDMICISVEAISREGYRRIAKVDLDYDEFRANVRDLYEHRGNCEVYIKIADTGLSPEDVQAFYDDFGSMADYITVEKLMGWTNSGLKDFTLGTNPNTFDGAPFTEKEVCAYPFYVMAVNADGRISVCSDDWSCQTIVGDVKKNTLKEIWNGEPLREFRRMHLNLERHKCAACANCYYLKIVPDNIDAYRLDLLRRL
jgi:radical SAM protein with 4Fe4S-binding SPASM domain